jgi:sulfur carrier protein
MEIIVNGEKTIVEEGCAVSDLLKKHQLNPQLVAVELNKKILKRDLFSQTLLSKGDAVEIVHFVGGG